MTDDATDRLERLAAAAEELAEVGPVHAIAQRVVDLAADLVPGCDAATLLVVRSDHTSSPAATSLAALRADRAEQAAGEGPCLSALRDERMVVVEDVHTEERWPAWREELTDWRSVLGVRLFVTDDSLGSLNLYARAPHAFDEDDLLVANALATHAAGAVRSAGTLADLEQALGEGDDVAVAKGILMAREDLSGHEAQQRLEELADDRGVDVRVVAADLAATDDET